MIYKKIGKILKGEYKDWNITIINDIEETGGYYVIYWDATNSTLGFDDWYENYESLLIGIKDIQIEWSENEYISRTPSEEEIKSAEEFRALAKKRGF